MKKMPISVKINTVTYDITEVEKLIDDRKTVAGIINYTNSTIEIDDNRSEDNKRICLMHEIAHAILNDSKINKNIDDDDLLENLCDVIAKGFIQVIRENGDLINYIK
jgi:Zn-dependent peptidase ImmA (M78 family)